ncbi:hypothetical protein TNCV_947781 [Trichonephila clavipes]|nr:hypothetical protein TNCV_947781 [Trichonephila clavipes]
MLGLDSNPGECMDGKCTVLSWHGGILNGGRAANPLWLVTLNAVLLDLDSNPGEGMDGKCTVLSWHGGILNGGRAANPFVRLGKGKRGESPLAIPRLFFLKVGDGTEPNCAVICMVLKTSVNY